MALKPEEQEGVQRGIWNGTFTLFSLPVILYNDVRAQLKKELFSGFGDPEDFEEGSKQFIKATKLEDNVTRFSAAKVFQQVKDERNFLFDKTGNIRSFFDFKKDADKIYGKYNTEWMRVERQATIANAQSAAQWIDIQDTKETLPLLQYRTAGDERVRPEHAAWEGITRPANDPFWDSHMPPNGFSCRCIVVQVESGKITNLQKRQQEIKKKSDGELSLKNKDESFARNAGKQDFIFKEKGEGPHPYFKVPKQFEPLKKRNFDLPI